MVGILLLILCAVFVYAISHTSPTPPSNGKQQFYDAVYNNHHETEEDDKFQITEEQIKLKNLRDAGTLTEEEYTIQCNKLLRQTSDRSLIKNSIGSEVPLTVSSSFQNNLSLNLRTKADIEKEQQEKLTLAIGEKINDEIERIKRTLLNNAQNGVYELNSDNHKVVVTISRSLTYGFDKVTEHDPFKEFTKWQDTVSINMSPSSRKQFYRNTYPDLKKASSEKKSIAISVKSEHQKELNMHHNLLSSVLEKDGISADPVVYFPDTQCTYAIPAIFEADNTGKYRGGCIAFKYSCVIPEINTSSKISELTNVLNNRIQQLESFPSDNNHTKDEFPLEQQSADAATSTNSEIDLDYMSGEQFEYFCSELLSMNGYTNIEVTKHSGDQGIDIIAKKDGVKYGIQCKCYSSSVGNHSVQEAYSGMNYYNCHVGVVLTNNYFTSSAIELANKLNIILWDRDFLNNFIKNSTPPFQLKTNPDFPTHGASAGAPFFLLAVSINSSI